MSYRGITSPLKIYFMTQAICSRKNYLFAILFFIGHNFIFSQKPYKIIATTSNKAEAILNWTNKMNEEYPGIDFYHERSDKLNPRMLNLFDDKYFVPVFGESLDEMGSVKRMQIGRSFRMVWTSKKWSSQFTWQKNVERPFIIEQGTFSYQELAKFLEKRRIAKKEYDKAYSLLSGKSESITGSDIKQYKQLVTKEFSDFWPSDIKKLNDLISANESLAAERHLKNTVSSILKIDNSYQSLLKAKQFTNQHNDLLLLVSKELNADISMQINNKINTILLALMKEERKKLEAIPSGEKGIITGNEWWASFTGKYSEFMYNDPVTKTKDYFVKLRLETLSMIRPLIESKIEKAVDKNELANLKSVYIGSLPSQNDLIAQLTSKVDNRRRIIDEQERKRNEKAKKDAEEKERLVEASLPRFITSGLHNEQTFRKIWKGDFLNLPFKRDEMTFSLIINAYITAYSKQCGESLPKNKIELLRERCEEWLVTKNGWGVEISRSCTKWVTEGTGVFASPEMHNAKSTIDRLKFADTFRNVFGMLFHDDAIGKTLQLVEKTQAIKEDVEVLLTTNGCRSPGLMRFQENLRLFALNE